MEGESIDVKESGFFNHIFKFDNDTKSTSMNILQYLFVSILPITIINTILNNMLPVVDETKGNLELLAEIMIHYSILLISIVLIHRLITYIPTYSGRAYPDLNIFNFILLFLIVSYHSSSKTGEKIKVLVNRANDIWEGKTNNDNNKNKKDNGNNVKITQPISGLRQAVPTHQSSRADYLSTHGQMTTPQIISGSTGQIPTQNINNVGGSGANNDMYNNNNFGGLQDTGFPVQEPMAANAFGGFSSSSW